MITGTKQEILRGVSQAKDSAKAVRELHDAIYSPDAELVIFFCSPSYELEIVADEIAQRFNDVKVIGCTTAGEITPAGYLNNSITGLSLPAAGFTTETTLIEDLDNFAIEPSLKAVKPLLEALEQKGKRITPQNTFAFDMIDGLSMREESVISALASSLGDIPIFGGSAGDALDFKQTYVYHEGRFRKNSAVLALIHTDRPFTVFKTQHFVDTDKKLVVTGADVERRIVTEINGEPAAREYARLVGVDADVEKLDPMVFATYPVVVNIGGAMYVRSIQKVSENDCLDFFCAIDEGIVLRLAKGVDFQENLEQVIATLKTDLGEPELIIGCDCILRQLEIERKNIKEEVGRTFAAINVVGFSTYGEQINGMHVNQTFTGVAIGAPVKGDV